MLVPRNFASKTCTQVLDHGRNVEDRCYDNSDDEEDDELHDLSLHQEGESDDTDNNKEDRTHDALNKRLQVASKCC